MSGIFDGVVKDKTKGYKSCKKRKNKNYRHRKRSGKRGKSDVDSLTPKSYRGSTSYRRLPPSDTSQTLAPCPSSRGSKKLTHKGLLPLTEEGVELC